MRDIYAPALRILDRRLVGWGALDGRDALVDFARGGTDLAPDLRVEIELLALGRRAGVHRQLARGHLEEGGGELEIEMVVLTLSQDGQGTHIELFDAAADDAALARFEEIGAQTDPERLTARVVRLVNARDWDRARRLLRRGLRVDRPPPARLAGDPRP